MNETISRADMHEILKRHADRHREMLIGARIGWGFGGFAAGWLTLAILKLVGWVP